MIFQNDQTNGQSVQECIDAYMELSQDVFKLDNVLLGVVPVGDNQCRFDYKNLEIAIKKIIAKRLDSEDVLMSAETKRSSCPTFVVAKLQENVDGPAYLFRSYRVPGFGPSQCTIWEAARATSAAPTFFKSMTISKPSPAAFVDGGLGHNNPAQIAREEAMGLWPASRSCCLVSLGTGHQNPVKIVDSSTLEKNADDQRDIFGRVKEFIRELEEKVPGWKKAKKIPPGVVAIFQMANAIARLMTNTETVHRQLVVASHSGIPEARFPYFRFNIERAVGDIGLGDWKKLKSIGSLAIGYMTEPEIVQKKLECVQWLITRK